MLWDLIRDYFVEYIFGGHNSNLNNFDNFFGSNVNGAEYYGNDLDILLPNFNNYGDNVTISIGDYLSTTATIITIVIIFVLCCLFIKKMVTTVFHLLGN